MANKGVGLNTKLVMPSVVIIATIAICLVLKPEEPTELYWVNLGFGVFWELIFFGWMALSRSETSVVSSVFKAVSGGMSLYYVIISFLIMLVYTIGLAEHIHIKWYICVLVVLTIIWYILGSLVAHYDNSFSDQQDMLNESKAIVTLNASKMLQLVIRCSQIYKGQGAKYATEANIKNPVERLSQKFQFISPNVLKNSMAVSQLNMIITTCDELLDNLESAEDKETFKKAEEKLERFVKTSIADIDFLKNTTRR